MNIPSIPDLHRRVCNLEEKQSNTSEAIRDLQSAMTKMEGDMQSIKERLVYADAARDRQTATLLDAINDKLRRAQGQVPTWASALITVLAMLCAALLTAHYG